MKNDRILRIGGASGYWGDAARATPQLLNSPGLDYIVYDYLAEITMSIMARARATDESKGYAVDFISAAMQPNLGLVAERGIKVISNAGGVNPEACAAALRAVIAEQNSRFGLCNCGTGRSSQGRGEGNDQTAEGNDKPTEAKEHGDENADIPARITGQRLGEFRVHLD